MAARAGPGETLSIPDMPAIEPRMIDIAEAGVDGGDEVEVDSLVQPDATPVCSGPVDVSIRMYFSVFNSLRSQFTFFLSFE